MIITIQLFQEPELEPEPEVEEEEEEEEQEDEKIAESSDLDDIPAEPTEPVSIYYLLISK